jgi:hypothetical protein
MTEKPKITGQLVPHGETYTAVWLIDGHKHTRQIHARDRKEANDKFKELMEKIKSHYER